MTYPSGKVLTYGFDIQGRIASMSVKAVNLVSGITYQPFGPAKSWTWSGGPVQTRAFDLDGRQISYPYTATGTVNLSYDLGNRIKNLTGTVAKTYGYDKLDRLTSYSNEIYNYDSDGNRSSHTVGATSYLYTNPTTSNRLTSMAGPTARTFIYDASGNVTNISTGFAFTYDARGRMTNITAGSVNQYGISAFGERTTKAGTGYTGTQGFVYGEDGKLLGEYDNTGVLITEHVYLQDTPIAAIKTAGAYVVQADHLNTPRAILGAGNVSAWTWNSDAFGTTAANEKPSTLATFNYNLRFPGKYYDKESALHYNYFRDYNPKTGRYIESDPIGLAGGINTFAYVDNDPLNSYDPYGLFGIADLPSVPQGVVDFSAGFGDGASFGLTSLIRDAAGIDGGVDQGSGLYQGSKIAGNLCTGTAGALRAGAAFGGTRLGNSMLNSNPFLRLGPGRMPKNNPFKASTKAPRLSIGKGPGNLHVDLRIRGIDQ